MNFYKRFIGDIQAKTGHLSLAEFGAYDRLLDHCYSTEQPLPADVDSVCRIARAMTREERKAVESVLRQFFKLTDDGYVQPRVLEMLAEARPKIEANRANGKKGGRPKSKPEETEQKPSGFSVGTQSKPNENLSQSQSQNTLSSLRSERVCSASRHPHPTTDWTLPEHNLGSAEASPRSPDSGFSDSGFSDCGLGTGSPAAQAHAKKQAEEAKTAPMDVTPPTGVPDASTPVGRTCARTPTDPPDDVAPQVWTDWLAVRKAKRAGPVTPTVLTGMRREAAKAGISLQDAVAHCCVAGWQGFRADWYLRDRQPAMRAAPTETYGEREEARKRRLYEEMAGRRPAATVIDVGAVDAIDAVLAVPGIGRNRT